MYQYGEEKQEALFIQANQTQHAVFNVGRGVITGKFHPKAQFIRPPREYSSIFEQILRTDFMNKPTYSCIMFWLSNSDIKFRGSLYTTFTKLDIRSSIEFCLEPNGYCDSRDISSWNQLPFKMCD